MILEYITPADATQMVLLFAAAAAAMATPALIETEQEYYLTRNSLPAIGGPSACASLNRHPESICDDPPFVMDHFNWTSVELKVRARGVCPPGPIPASSPPPSFPRCRKLIARPPPARAVTAAAHAIARSLQDVVLGVDGKPVGFYDCVTYTVCGYRIYAGTGVSGVMTAAGPARAARPLSNPREYTLLRDSRPLLGPGACTAFPPPRCPGPDMGCCMGNKSWYSRELLRGTLAANGSAMVAASECVTTNLCAHRIYESGRDRTPAAAGLSPRGPASATTPDTPLQLLEIRASRPKFPKDGIVTSPCSGDDYPPIPDCSQMHLFVAQTNTYEPVIKGALQLEPGSITGFYDCAVKALCAYANPPPLLGADA